MNLALRFPRFAAATRTAAGVDLRTLALFRILLGLVLLATVLGDLGDLSAFWTDHGIIPREWLIAATPDDRLSLFLAAGSTWFASLLVLLLIANALLLTLGWHTRMAAIVGFVLWSSLLNRSPPIVDGADALIAALLFWSMLLPLGARASVDVALAESPPPSSIFGASFASLGLLLQVVGAFFFGTLLLHAQAPSVDALGDMLGIADQVGVAGRWLTHAPSLAGLLDSASHLLALLSPLLVFSPWGQPALRLIALAGLAAIQLGMLLLFDLGHLPWACLAAVSVLVPGQLWDRLDARHRQRHAEGLRIYYDRDCAFCLKSCRLMQQFLILPRAELAAAQDNARARTLMEANNSWVVIDGEEVAFLKWAAFAALVRHSPLWSAVAPLLQLRAVEPAGNRIYDFVVRRRARFGRLTAMLLPARNPRWTVTAGWQGFAAVAAILLLAWNLGSVGLLPGAMTRPLASLLRPLALDSGWDRIAPDTRGGDGWLAAPGRLVDDSEVDLLRPQQDVPRFDRPARDQIRPAGLRWRHFRAALTDAPDPSGLRRHYARYLCRQWNAGHDGARALASIKLVYLQDHPTKRADASPDNRPGNGVEQRVLWRQDCSEAAKVPTDAATDGAAP